MSRIAVCNLASVQRDSSQEQTGQRRFQTSLQQIAIDGSQRRCRASQRRDLHLDHAHYMGEPHPGGQSLSGDIADSEHQAAIKLKYADEVARQMTDGKNLAGDLKGLAAKKARAAEFSLHLGGFIHGAPQVVVFAAQCRKLVLERPVAAGNVCKSKELSRVAGDLRPMRPWPILASASDL